jgi:hypothetical protein
MSDEGAGGWAVATARTEQPAQALPFAGCGAGLR